VSGGDVISAAGKRTLGFGVEEWFAAAVDVFFGDLLLVSVADSSTVCQDFSGCAFLYFLRDLCL